jgi:acetamidase/formamidase
MSQHHTVSCRPEHCHWGFFDAALKPVATLASGDTVSIDCVSGGPEVLPSGSGFEILGDHRAILDALSPKLGAHILTGPVAVEGAEPGDVLEIEILSVEPRQNWGYTRIRPLAGTLPEDFPIRKTWHSMIDRQRGVMTTPWGLEIELAPFFGVMGVAPPPVYGACSSIQPREFGGNMDLKELTAGEVCVTALETALSGTFRLTLRKDLHFTLPRAETPTHHVTMAFNEDLDDAAKDALREMIKLIGERMGLPADDAYMFSSLAVDMRVTQLVDGNKGIHAMLPKRYCPS